MDKGAVAETVDTGIMYPGVVPVNCQFLISCCSITKVVVVLYNEGGQVPTRERLVLLSFWRLDSCVRTRVRQNSTTATLAHSNWLLLGCQSFSQNA